MNIGGEDNPIRSLVDINDLSPFNIVSSQSKSDALRETYNSLLRSLGNLKDCYYKYRSMLQTKQSDPFTLNSAQFWVFLRDHDLVSPSGCTLAKINRATSGWITTKINS